MRLALCRNPNCSALPARWVLLGWLGMTLAASGATNLSRWVLPGNSGRLLSKPDALGNRILDYSAAGYKGGTVPIPEVPVKTTIAPVAGDDGANLQAAINIVKALPLDPNGFRGAVLLTAGEYQISNSITIDASGVILRGMGDGTNGTILRAAGPGQRTLVFVSGSGSRSYSGTARNITNLYVPVGARSFNVDTTSGLAVGDRVMIHRPSTTNWIADLGMDLLGPGSGGAADVVPWTAGSKDVDSDRVITRIEANRIIIDAPLTCALETKYGGGTIRKFTWSGRINNVGIEDLRGDSDYLAPDDEDHGWVFISLDSVENAWVRRVTSQHFGYACVQLSSGTRTTTVRDCKSLDPVSIITGSRRYAFPLNDCTLCLVQNCYTDEDRHQFVTHSLTHGPNVFVDGLSDTAHSDAGPHHRWATGAIWDNVTVNGNNLNVQNRGNSGTGHGWAGANEVVWNSKANGFVVQNPPTARNWLIGSVGAIQAGTMWVGPHDPGTYDSHGSNVFPNSLYYAQLQDRLAAPALQTREYWVGEINQFSNANPSGTAVTVDAAWLAQIQSPATAAGASVSGFDLVTNSQFVPFTFNFSLGATDRVVAASLALAMRASASSTNESLYLDSTNNPLTFAQLNWLPVGTDTNTTVRVLDLGAQLSLLADGKLNLAVSDDVGIDWAMLELQIAPVQTLVTNFPPPVADAYVRGGASANSNFSASTMLDVKLDSTADNLRQAYLRWNLAGYSPRLQHARLRLTPVSVGTNGLEHGLTLAKSNSWNTGTITWNNQPGGGKRFATWIPGTNGAVEVVVTPQVQGVLAGDGQLSFELFSLKNVGGPGLVSYASSEAANAAIRPQLLLVYSNTVPGISSVPDQVMPANTNSGPIPFVIGDAGYAANLLTLGAMSSDPSLVPVTNLVFGGSLSNRTITVTPLAGNTGTTLLTLIVTNPAGLTAGSQFTLTVTNAADTNSVPTLAPPGDRGIPVNTNTGPIPITIADSFYDPALLTLGAVSANAALVPAGGLLFGGTGGDRTLTVTPSLTQTGTALITVTVTNPTGATATGQFTLIVTNFASSATASGAWIVDASGDWGNSANWSGGIIATGLDSTASFAVDVTASRYVNNNSARTIGNLTFHDANPGSAGAWFITNNPLTLQLASGTPTIAVSNTTATLAAPLGGAQGLAKTGDGTLILAGANSYSGATTISYGPLRAANDNAPGASSGATTIGSDPTARLELTGGVTLAEPFTINCKGSANGNVPAVLNISGTNTLAGTLSLTTGGSFWTFEAAAGKLRVTGNTTNITTTNVRTVWLRGAAEGEWLSAIGDSAAALGTAIRKDDTGLWTLAGNNTYTGNTVVSNGTLRVNGTVRGAVIVYGGTLGGTGVITAPVTIYPGATLAPGASIGDLTLSNNLTLAAGSTTAVELNAQSLTCDRVLGLSNLVYAGVLVVTNVAGALVGGQSFQLFSAASSSGNFSSLSPVSPGTNLAWNFNPTNGILSVLSLAPPQITSLSVGAGSSFNLSGTGPAAQPYRILAATNIALPLSNWTVATTGSFLAGLFNFTDAPISNQVQKFYRVVTP